MKILVIGDSCLDVFQYGKIKRLSPEAPVPIFNPTYKTEKFGMAGNVYENLLALNVERVEIVTNEIKPIKTRFVDEVSNQQMIRIDEFDIIKRIKYHNFGNTWDGIIISDYNKGFLKESDIEEIGRICKRDGIITFLDTKKKLDWDNMDFLKNIDFIKINEVEYQQNELALTQGAWYFGDLIVTLGNRGAKHFHGKNQSIDYYPIEKKAEVRDLSGAGDTFLAAFAISYLEDRDIGSSIKYGNRCASYVVTQKGVVVVDLDKI